MHYITAPTGPQKSGLYNDGEHSRADCLLQNDLRGLAGVMMASEARLRSGIIVAKPWIRTGIFNMDTGGGLWIRISERRFATEGAIVVR